MIFALASITSVASSRTSSAMVASPGAASVWARTAARVCSLSASLPCTCGILGRCAMLRRLPACRISAGVT
jgi:hypothetical protein